MLVYSLRIAVLSFLLLSTNALLAQKNTWDLQTCIDYALKNNLQLQQNSLNIARAQSNLSAAKEAFYPNLNASSSLGSNFGRSIDPFTNTFVNKRIESVNTSIGANMTLYNGGTVRQTIQQNSVDLSTEQANLQRAQNDLMLNVASAFLLVLQNTELLNNAKLQIVGVKEQIDRTEKLIKAGALAESAIFTLNSQLATNEVQIVNAENGLMLAKIQLKQLLQMPANEVLEIAVPILPDVDVNAVLMNTDEIYAAAESTLPQIKAADLGIKSSAIGIKLAQANRLPVITFGANAFTGYSSAQNKFFEGDGTKTTVELPVGYLGSDPTQLVFKQQEIPNGKIVDFGFGRQFKESFRHNYGLSLQVPIYNRGQVRNATRQAQIRLSASEINAKIVRNQLRQTIEQAYADARAAQASFTANTRRYEVLKQSYDMTEKSLALGRANASEFNLAKNNLDIAQNELIRAKYDYIFRLKVLDFYMGKPLSL
ncbi:MAG: TolC family protein [Cytophagales bacterium]|nr:MAG: TolC family protein [Cytophagales bacterium]TAF60968.1 MAG: TolC family protein [Cytophagales bacterium]